MQGKPTLRRAPTLFQGARGCARTRVTESFETRMTVHRYFKYLSLSVIIESYHNHSMELDRTLLYFYFILCKDVTVPFLLTHRIMYNPLWGASDNGLPSIE